MAKTLVGEGKSKRIFVDNGLIILELKGDVRCSTQPTRYDERIAELRTEATCQFFSLLGTSVDGVARLNRIGPHAYSMVQTTPLPLEWIPRFIAAGSVVKRFGFQSGHVFKNPVLKIDYKTEMDDYLINDDLIVEKGILTRERLRNARQIVLDAAVYLRHYCAEKGLSLWDLKMEIGVTDSGQILIIDEISFDGMRLKDSETGESLDKDIYRTSGDLDALIWGYEKALHRLFPECGV